MTLQFLRNFSTGSETQDIQLDIEEVAPFDVIGTLTKISGSSRTRLVTDQISCSLLSVPLFDSIQLPEGADDLFEDDPEKWEYEQGEWWQGRWEIYGIFAVSLGIYFVARYLQRRRADSADAQFEKKKDAEAANRIANIRDEAISRQRAEQWQAAEQLRRDAYVEAI